VYEQEACRRGVERAFRVLQSKFAIVAELGVNKWYMIL
jgi:hypothetical protein